MSEQLNIVGRRCGQGFVCHRLHLVNSLSTVQSPTVKVLGLTLGTRGLTGFLRLSNRSNIVTMIPVKGKSNDEARLRVEVGSYHTSLEHLDWTTEKTQNMIPCEVKVKPKGKVIPNISGTDLAFALARVLPFASKTDDRPVLKGVQFRVGNGKLTVASCDGFSLAQQSIDFDYESNGDIEALIDASELKGILPHIRKSRRLRLSFVKPKALADPYGLTIDTESIHYQFDSISGKYPDYEKLIPEDKIKVEVDSRELLQATASIGSLAVGRQAGLTLSLEDNKLTISVMDDRGKATVEVIGTGKARTGINSKYLTTVCKAIDDMASVSFSDSPGSPIKFCVDGYTALVMPLATKEAEVAEAEVEVAEAPEEAVAKAEAPEAVAKAA